MIVRGKLFFSHYREMTTFIGDFYEVLTEKIFGGKRTPCRNFLQGELWPDVEIAENNICIESKASSVKSSFIVSLNQIEKYRALLEFPYSHIWYAFYSHNLSQICQNYPTEDLLIKALCVGTQRLTVLDLGIVESLRRITPTTRYMKHKHYKFSPEHIYQVVCFSHKKIWRFENDWKSFLKEISLSEKNFQQEEREINVELFGEKISFPMTKIVKY